MQPPFVPPAPAPGARTQPPNDRSARPIAAQVATASQPELTAAAHGAAAAGTQHTSAAWLP